METEISSNEEMLELIRADRPGQVINEVLSFTKNSHGFYDVKVYMESLFPENIAKYTIPYPLKEFRKLSEAFINEWVSNNF